MARLVAAWLDLPAEAQKRVAEVAGEALSWAAEPFVLGRVHQFMGDDPALPPGGGGEQEENEGWMTANKTRTMNACQPPILPILPAKS